jgi:biopolymer transport protein ExbB/TolQ
MFTGADIVVQTVMVGLAFASVVTWTVWLAKSLELLAARRSDRRLVTEIASARSLGQAVEVAGSARSPIGAMVGLPPRKRSCPPVSRRMASRSGLPRGWSGSRPPRPGA